MVCNMEPHMGKALEVRPRKSTNVTLPPEVLERANRRAKQPHWHFADAHPDSSAACPTSRLLR